MSTSDTGTIHHLASSAGVAGGSENSDPAVQRAAETASQRDRGLMIVHAVDLP
ncbi:hypothetical protein [Nocardia araoensis]|uniref:hypothetical protein n=1 Tax=Nocardia araoensis TaxID=228600 RepID=UPI00031F0C69|nr:hypothetical protein [Nocardia araoensis]